MTNRGSGRRRVGPLAVIGLIASASAISLSAAWADDPLRFEVPVDCAIGSACIVQNYVDHDPGPGASDQTCGPLSYNNHRGIDFRVPGRPEMDAGVAVIAAAPGVVRAVQDDMPDVSIRETGSDPALGREAGNMVVITHGDGWETQYSHLRGGSVRVRPGQRVETGTPLGLIGLSGKTKFPHLHFAVRHGGQTLDPFTGRPPGSGCGRPGTPLWSADAQAALAYRAGGLLAAGFAAETPTIWDALAGQHRAATLPSDAAALVFWAAAWGLRADDREDATVIGPNGRVFAESRARVPKNKAQWLRFTGRTRKAETWPPGRYRGTYRVLRERDGETVTVVDVTREVEVR